MSWKATLGDIRAHAKYRKVPILCVLGSWGRMLSEVAVEGLDHAVKAMMANGFLNLLHFADDEDGNTRIRRIVDGAAVSIGVVVQLQKNQPASTARRYRPASGEGMMPSCPQSRPPPPH